MKKREHRKRYLIGLLLAVLLGALVGVLAIVGGADRDDVDAVLGGGGPKGTGGTDQGATSGDSSETDTGGARDDARDPALPGANEPVLFVPVHYQTGEELPDIALELIEDHGHHLRDLAYDARARAFLIPPDWARSPYEELDEDFDPADYEPHRFRIATPGWRFSNIEMSFEAIAGMPVAPDGRRLVPAFPCAVVRLVGVDRRTGDPVSIIGPSVFVRRAEDEGNAANRGSDAGTGVAVTFAAKEFDDEVTSGSSILRRLPIVEGVSIEIALEPGGYYAPTTVVADTRQLRSGVVEVAFDERLPEQMLRLAIQVERPDGSPAQGARLFPLSDWRIGGRDISRLGEAIDGPLGTDASGTVASIVLIVYEVDGVDHVSNFVVTHPDYPPLRPPFPISDDGETVVIRLLPGEFTVSGHVVDPADAPIEGAEVMLVYGSLDTHNLPGGIGIDFATTDAQGRFQFDNVSRDATRAEVLSPPASRPNWWSLHGIDRDISTVRFVASRLAPVRVLISEAGVGVASAGLYPVFAAAWGHRANADEQAAFRGLMQKWSDWGGFGGQPGRFVELHDNSLVFTNVIGGEYDLHVSLTDGGQFSQRITHSALRETTVVIPPAQPITSIDVELRIDGRPLPLAWVIFGSLSAYGVALARTGSMYKFVPGWSEREDDLEPADWLRDRTPETEEVLDRLFGRVLERRGQGSGSYEYGVGLAAVVSNARGRVEGGIQFAERPRSMVVYFPYAGFWVVPFRATGVIDLPVYRLPVEPVVEGAQLGEATMVLNPAYRPGVRFALSPAFLQPAIVDGAIMLPAIEQPFAVQQYTRGTLIAPPAEQVATHGIQITSFRDGQYVVVIPSRLQAGTDRLRVTNRPASTGR